MGKKKNAYLTVYLSMILAVLLSLCLTLIDGARRNAVRLKTEIAMDIAMNSLLAEYSRELYKQYNIFAIDDSYMSELGRISNVENHLEDYAAANFGTDQTMLSGLLVRGLLDMSVDNSDVCGVSYLTDKNGAVFRQRAAEAYKDDCGLTYVSEIKDLAETVRSENLENGTVKEDLARDCQIIDGEIHEYYERKREENERRRQLGEEEEPIEAADNPASALASKAGIPLEKMILGESGELSAKKLELEDLYSRRPDKSIGNIEAVSSQNLEAVIEAQLFREYLFRYMGNYMDTDPEDALEYQIEYLISGKDSDIKNITGVAGRIFAIRMTSNFAVAQSEGAGDPLIETISKGLAFLLGNPGLESVIREAILLGWSLLESTADVQTIFKGGKVPLKKSISEWHYTVEKALFGGVEEAGGTGGEGLDYKTYLRIFMELTGTETLTSRAIDMVEADLRLTSGNEGFRMDDCIDMLEAKLGIRSGFGYEYEITRRFRYE